ncbi:helix-turn-helix transcriptional regulator [Galbibacter sp. PAP.153]|uniref:helix-turn-helix domain-containing protein n=1 Tax=Galbibacter sp. PAP.153 TaxID=3104623 RepID=UPI00300A7F92
MYKFKTISDYHQFVSLPKPEHPLVSLVNYGNLRYPLDLREIRWTQNYYSIGLKRNVRGKLRYGQQEYDFDEGILSFIAPQQVLHVELDQSSPVKATGWLLLIHPDFLWNTSLARKIKNYDFFGYAVNEALFMSEKEEHMMIGILKNIQREYRSSIDKFSQNIIVSQIEVLLNYAERYYQRQFITRNIANNRVLSQMEDLLSGYFDKEEIMEKGLPTVHDAAEQLHMSPNYLSSMLKTLTGLNAQQHIHEKLIEKAKEKLSTTGLSVSEIAYTLGFEHSQSFSRLFKSKTKLSPLAFRKLYN